jgi:hypothetical protein
MALKLDKNFKPLMKNYRLVPHLDKYISKGDQHWTFVYDPKQGDSAWHPSSDCTPSVYELYRKAKGELDERAPTPALYKTFMTGHFWHQYVQNMLLDMGFCDEDAIERRGKKSWGEGPFHWVTGSADVAPVTIPVHGDFLLDIKTMNSHDFRRPGLSEWSGDKWECQTNIYMDFFDLDRAMILGIQKDSPHEFKEFIFERNQDLIDAIYLKWKLVAECLDTGVVPEETDDVELPLQGAVKQ